jgi:8-oxo-dGTP diphosphatase
MIYVACDAIEGEACVVDDEELVDFAWVKRDRLAEYVPYGCFPAVQDYLDATLSA